ncbi:MAG: peptidase M48, partial [Variovorax sp.]
MPRLTPSSHPNPPPRRFLRALCAALLIASQVALPPAARAQLLPGMGDGAEMTASAERHLGDQI